MTKNKKTMLSKEAMEEYEHHIKHAEGIMPEVEIPEALMSKKGSKTRLSKEEREARLVLVQRLLFRNIPKKEIAKQLGVTPRHLSRMIKELETHTVNEVQKMDFSQFVGNTLTFYDEIRGMALIMASDKGATKKEKLQSMQVALKAESEKHNFFSLCGVYKSPHAIEEARKMIAPENTVDGKDVTSIITGLAKHLLAVNPKDVKDYHLDGTDTSEAVDAEIVEEPEESDG
jgi:Trp operon repressor